MLYVQQQYFLHAHRRMSVDVLAVASLCTCSAQQIYSTKTRHVNIAMYITMLKLSESCYDRVTIEKNADSFIQVLQTSLPFTWS